MTKLNIEKNMHVRFHSKQQQTSDSSRSNRSTADHNCYKEIKIEAVANKEHRINKHRSKTKNILSEKTQQITIKTSKAGCSRLPSCLTSVDRKPNIKLQQ